MADSVTDKFRYVADRLRSLRAPTVFGVEQVQMQIVTRTWLGGSRGADGGYVESVLTIPNFYKIVEVDPEELPDTGGRFEKEFVRVGPITPNYTVGSTSGGFTRAQLAPSGVKGVEIIYRLIGSLTGEFKREHIETYRGFQFNLVLSRSRTSNGQSGGADATIATLPNLFAWYRGDIISPAIWSDQSGNGRDALQATTALQPGSVASGIGGQPCASFSGVTFVSSQYYNLPSLASLTAAEIFMVVKTDVDNSIGGLYNFGTSGLVTTYKNVNIYDDFGSTVRRQTSGGEPDTSTPHLYNVISTSTEWTLNIDGVQLLTTPSNTVAFTGQPAIGSSIAGGTPLPLNGQIADVLIFSAKNTNANRAIVKAYAAAHYPGLVVA